jgi:type I site-specific restriction endonuclease
VGTIILNRATKSLTLYHQMIGRGSRVLPNKKEFTVLDLGNNARRFGLWDAHVNWQDIFQMPNSYIDGLYSDEEIEREFVYEMPEDVKAQFIHSTVGEFKMKKTYRAIMEAGGKPRDAIAASIEHHAQMVCDNADDLWDGLDLIKLLDQDIEYRVKRYSHCIAKTTENYLTWLQTEYSRKLEAEIRKRLDY